jgi:hypothetical protein
MVDNPKKRLVFKDPFYFRVKDVDIYNLKALYTMIHEWFVEEEYCDDDGEFPEYYMRERITKRGKEILILWRFHKHPFGINFYNRTYDVLIKIVGVKDVEVMQEGKKFKLQKGSFEIKVWSQLEYDAEEKWRKHSILKNFLDIFVNRIYKKEMEMHREELKVEVESLQNSIKEFLNLIRYDTKSPNLKNVTGMRNPYM